MFEAAAAVQRWTRIRTMMATCDLDAVVAVDVSRDEILLGNQRWISGYIPVGGPAAALVHRDGDVTLISDRIGRPVTEYYRSHGFVIELVGGFSPTAIADALARRAARRVGFAERDAVSHAIALAIGTAVPWVTLVDVSTEFAALRLRKEADEIAAIRRSAAIADAVAAELPAIFRVGRPTHAVAADVDHLVRLAGAEGGFNLVLRLPFVGRAMRSTADPEPIAADARYLVEISPRFEGYYAQLTLPVTTMPADDAVHRAYADLIAVKTAAEADLRPGTELGALAATIRDALAARGRALSSLSLGHFCGMALEEPRHDPTVPMILEAGMTLIFHPVLADPDLHSLMRADTYLIGATGVERLTRHPGGIVEVGRTSG